MVLSYRSHRAPLLDTRTPFSFTRSPVAAQKFELLRLEYKCFLPFFFDQLPYFYWQSQKLYLESVILDIDFLLNGICAKTLCTPNCYVMLLFVTFLFLLGHCWSFPWENTWLCSGGMVEGIGALLKSIIPIKGGLQFLFQEKCNKQEPCGIL